MDFRQINIEEIATLKALCGTIVVTNGMLYYKELPDFGSTSLNLTSHNGKVTIIEESVSKKTKL